MLRNAPLPILLFLLVSASATAQREVVAPPGADLTRPYSPAIAAGDFIYLSGSIGTPPGGELRRGFAAQARQVFDNLGDVLRTAGADFSRVVQIEAFLADPRHFEEFNRIYLEVFKGDKPVRATVGADLPLNGALIEVAAIAARPGLELKRIRPRGWPESARYSWGIQAGDTLFVAGMVSRDVPAGRIVGEDVGEQTRKALDNVGAVLEAAGFDYSDVVSSKAYLADARDFGDFNQAYRGYFPEPRPTRATVRADLMSPAVRVEILCAAVRDPSREAVAPQGASASGAPFSPSIVAGGRQFLSGMVGRGPGGYGDIRQQIEQTLDNLEATLKAAGLAFTDVAEANVYLSDIRHYDLLNEVYSRRLPDSPPARTTVGMQLMSPQASVEIRMVAVEGKRE